jgi:hypothetical protein
MVVRERGDGKIEHGMRAALFTEAARCVLLVKRRNSC